MSVKEPTPSQRVGVVASLLVGGSALAWLLSLQSRPPDVIGRLGLLAAFFCASAVFVFSWAAIVAYAAYRRDWEPRTTYLAGALSLFLIGGLYFFLAEPLLRMAGVFVFTLASFSGYITRRLAYPEMTDEQATAPDPPPTMFPK